MKTMVTVLGVLSIAAATALAQSPTLVDRGRSAFVEEGCYGCHTVGKFGTPIGPDLAFVGDKHDRAYLERWLRDPSSQEPAHMPKLELSEAQISALAAFLSSLRGG
jgi:cytochrome c oxidase subunit II